MKYLVLKDFKSGFVPNVPPHLLSANDVANAKNVLFRNRYISNFGGFKKLGDTTTGDILKLIEFKDIQGNYYLFCLTTSKIYKYDTSNDVWTDMTGTLTLNGSLDNSVSFVAFENTLIINNQSEIIKWTPGDNEFSALSGFTGKAKWISKYGNRLILFNTTESDTRYPQRVRWSALGECEDFSSTGSGYADLVSQMRDDEIICVYEMGAFAILYGKNNVCLMEYRGHTDAPFGFSSRVIGQGVRAPLSFVVKGGVHYFADKNGIAYFDGGREIKQGASVMQSFISSDMNESYDHRNRGLYDSKNNEILFAYAKSGSSTPNRELIFNEDERWWSLLDFQAQEWVYTTQYGLLIANSNQAYQYDKSLSTFDGTDINCEFETADITDTDQFSLIDVYWKTINICAKGTSFDVYYSTDRGQNWTKITTITPSNDWNYYNIDTEIYGDTIRLKITSSSDFAISMISLGLIPLSEGGSP